ncbi:tetraspanin-9-like [Oculina patagonica]
MTSADKNTKTIKSLVLFFNAIFFVFGWVLVGVGSWALYEFDAYEAVSVSVPYAAASKLIITAGVFNVLASFFGFWAASKDNKHLFVIFFLVLVVILGLEISAAASGYHHREKVSQTLYDDMIYTIQKLYGIKTDPSNALDALQENGRCCGAYNYTDWRDSYFTKGNVSVVPESCCKEPRRHCGENFDIDNIYTKGCYKELLYGKIRGKLYYVAVIAVPAAVFKVLGVLCVLLLIMRMEQTAEKVPLSVPRI